MPAFSPRPATREIEFKYAVNDAGAFKRLIDYLGKPASLLNDGVLQVNHFFDTRDFALRATGSSVRLREQNGGFKLTVKADSRACTDPGALSDRAEYEAEIHTECAEEFLSNRFLPLARLKAALSPHLDALSTLLEPCAEKDGLAYIGHFRNTRIHLPVTLGAADNRYELTLEFDTSEFPGCRPAYEIEVEISPGKDAAAVQDVLERLLVNAGVAWQTTTNKAARFFAALEKQNNPE